jgi:hypothetical protein
VQNEWENRSPKKKENTEREQDRAADAGLMDQLFDVTIYIYVGSVLER